MAPSVTFLLMDTTAASPAGTSRTFAPAVALYLNQKLA